MSKSRVNVTKAALQDAQKSTLMFVGEPGLDGEKGSPGRTATGDQGPPGPPGE